MVQYRISIPLRMAIDMIHKSKVSRYLRYRLNLSSIGEGPRYVEMYCSMVLSRLGMIPEAARFVLVRLP